MRNKTAFIFVLLANMVLLAHAVIPHHHHNEKLISVAVELSHHKIHDQHNFVPFCHEDHEDQETRTCILAQTFFIPDTQFRVVKKSVIIKSTDILFYTLLVNNFSSQDSCVTESQINKGYIPIPTRFLYPVQGLRAPPVC